MVFLKCSLEGGKSTAFKGYDGMKHQMKDNMPIITNLPDSARLVQHGSIGNYVAVLDLAWPRELSCDVQASPY